MPGYPGPDTGGYAPGNIIPMGDHRLSGPTFNIYAQQAYQNQFASAQQQAIQEGMYLSKAFDLPPTPTEPEEFRWLRRRIEEVMIQL